MAMAVILCAVLLYIYIKKLRQEVTENEENQQKGAENCRASNEK